MKRMLVVALVAGFAFASFAEEENDGEKSANIVLKETKRRESNVWPAFFAFSEFPANPDVVGLRLTIPFSTVQDNVTGVDVGLWGRALYFQGFQFNILRNVVTDELSGLQIGLYNSVGNGQLAGLQVGLLNEANMFRGVQVGIINLAGEVEGFQFGLINRAETMNGYQLGLINVIRDAELQFCPIFNIGW